MTVPALPALASCNGLYLQFSLFKSISLNLGGLIQFFILFDYLPDSIGTSLTVLFVDGKGISAFLNLNKISLIVLIGQDNVLSAILRIDPFHSALQILDLELKSLQLS